MKQLENCRIISQTQIEPGIFDLWLEAGAIADAAAAGQFVSVYTRDPSRLLPRPVSLAQIDRESGRIRLIYRVTGPDTGTEQLSKLHAGVPLRVLGPLGNGFPLQEVRNKKVLLFGGGIGIPPRLETARALAADHGTEVTAVLGYRTGSFLADEFREVCHVLISTEDGSVGTRGTVLDAVRSDGRQADAAFACGPRAMLRAVKEYCEAINMPCWISMEERMACGIGACLGCVCETKEVDGHSHVHNARICKDGPVFVSTEVVL